MRIGLISLGCAKNLVDAELMLGALLKDGFQITNDASEADAMIVNTCSFIDAAQEESVDTILESDQVREANNRGQALIVSGCLPQRFRAELPALLPEIDAFMGIDQVAEVGHVVRQAMQHRAARIEATPRRRVRRRKVVLPEVRDVPGKPAASPAPETDAARAHVPAGSAPVSVTSRPVYIPDYATPRFRLTPRHFAYLKIAEGCNHPCSFCIIPQMRGSHRSRAQKDVVREARRLLDEGVKELNLISQDSTYYGMDLRSNRSGSIASPEKFGQVSRALPTDATTLCTLLEALDGLRGEFWIRLLYTHPAHWTDELIRTMAGCSKVARYVDMPLQHIHDHMLERMRRETSREYIVDLIRRIRQGIPGIALRTTFIVGFPGETEDCFESLLEFIRETHFERLGVFTYSQEGGTRAAKMEMQLPETVKARRRKLAMAEQLKVARQVSQRALGRTLKVLVEKNGAATGSGSFRSWEHGFLEKAVFPKAGEYATARSEADAPEIDGRVYVKGSPLAGEFCQVRIVGAGDYDLVAEPIAGNS